MTGKRRREEEASWKTRAREADRKLRPFLARLMGEDMARTMALILLLVDEVRGLPVLRDKTHERLLNASDETMNSEVRASILDILKNCEPRPDRPLSAEDHRLKNLLNRALGLLDEVE